MADPTRGNHLLRSLYTIDPGLSGTGWARWDVYREGVALRECGVLSEPKEFAGEDWWLRAWGLTARLTLAMRPVRGRAYIEFPQYMGGSVKGIAASKGDTLKLAFLVGCYSIALRKRDIDVHLVIPQRWKGQLPKDVVISRVRRELGDELCQQMNIRSHAWDAVGLGLWAIPQL